MKKIIGKSLFVLFIYFIGCIVCYQTVANDIDNPKLFSCTSWMGAVIVTVISHEENGGKSK